MPQASKAGASNQEALPLSQIAGAVQLLHGMGEAGAEEEEEEKEMVVEREHRKGQVKKSKGVSFEEYQECLLQIEQEQLEVTVMKSMLTVMSDYDPIYSEQKGWAEPGRAAAGLAL